MQEQEEKPDSFLSGVRANRYFWYAIAAVIALQIFDQDHLFLWPLGLIGTYVHELFHGLFVLLAGGAFYDMVVTPDLGGMASLGVDNVYQHGISAIGGLMAPVIVGAIIIYFSRKFLKSKLVLRIVATCVVLSAFIWAQDDFTLGFCIVFFVLVVGISFIPSRRLVRFFALFLGVQLCLQNIVDFDYMFMPGFEANGQYILSDTGVVANAFGGTYWVWAIGLAALTLTIIVLAMLLSEPDENYIK